MLLSLPLRVSPVVNSFVNALKYWRKNTQVRNSLGEG
jgi:hypothetical protein